MKFIVLAPLFGFLFSTLAIIAKSDRMAVLLPTAIMTIVGIISMMMFQVGNFDEPVIETLFDFLYINGSYLQWEVGVDNLSMVMVCLITFVSANVHIYSLVYMSEDEGKGRFFAFLSLFTFMMLMLVTSTNLVQMFFGWEGVGLASYLLIGFWFEKESANKASMKAFIVNRVGDFGFALGIFTCFAYLQVLDFATLNAKAPELAHQTIQLFGLSLPLIDTIALLLFVGAMGKSAQFILHTWLPDAMEGPTPVSALIHAATMVTAGVFMLARLSPLFANAHIALDVVMVIGAITALFSATVAVTQNDIKRVIAYSTCSQLGYMFMAAGAGAFNASVFHLFTHGFFKALLFLSAGSVIHGLHHEQDLRKMGGLYKIMPITFLTALIGNIAITGMGIPHLFGFSGFYSKDWIIESLYLSHSPAAGFAFSVALIVVVLTSFYSWRLFFMTFLGSFRGDEETYEHAHESPGLMLMPLILLAIPSALFGALYIGNFQSSADYLKYAMYVSSEVGEHHLPLWVIIAPISLTLVGLLMAYLLYIRHTSVPNQFASTHVVLYQFLYRKWWIDEIYDFIIVKPFGALSRWCASVVDSRWIDGFGVNGLVGLTVMASERFRKIQTGYVYHYVLIGVVGLVALLVIV